jgi:hypothetical protein
MAAPVGTAKFREETSKKQRTEARCTAQIATGVRKFKRFLRCSNQTLGGCGTSFLALDKALLVLRLAVFGHADACNLPWIMPESDVPRARPVGCCPAAGMVMAVGLPG